MWWIGIAASVGLLLSLILLRQRCRAAKHGAVISTVVLAIAVAALSFDHDSKDTGNVSAAEVPARTPERDLSGGYASADACRECHQGQYDSWHHSFHRTMTQAVTPETMAAPLGDVRLESRDREFHLWREGDAFWVEMVDPEWDREQKRLRHGQTPADGPRVRRQIVMSTGSHHYQTYWINGTRGNQLWQVPWVYHLETDRWIPVEDVMIHPPTEYRRVSDWNDACIKCHAVRGIPGLDEREVYHSRVVDLGIACEACHGPGQEHIDFHRQAARGDASAPARDDSIVNPAALDHDRSAQVCGQCHSMFHYDVAEYLRSGFRYRPGDDLNATRSFYDYGDEETQSQHWLPDAYWMDGAIRVAGAEYSSLKASACYQHGTLSCLSCHSMHGYQDRDDQLRPGMRSDQACLQCHEDFADDVTAHTHHAADSAGSRCYNCHMPHSSFALLKGIRSHEIDSPSAQMTLDYGRPNACNLCHMDKTLRWTSDALTDWYGHDPVATSQLADETSAAALMMISGDAVQRAVIAWNMGQDKSRAASGSDWQPRLLAHLLDDPYSVVRYVAHKSIMTYPKMGPLSYDFLAPKSEREAKVREAIRLWEDSHAGNVVGDRTDVLLRESGRVDEQRLQLLMKLRDDRPVTLPE